MKSLKEEMEDLAGDDELLEEEHEHDDDELNEDELDLNLL
jgi:hypothetical protein